MRAAGIFGVGRRPDTSSAVDRSSEKNFRAGHYKDLTDTGNRARKVSGTQGMVLNVSKNKRLSQWGGSFDG